MSSFSVIMSRSEISHMLKRFMFRCTTELHTETIRQEMFQYKRYMIKNAPDEVFCL
ncbi:hypothetical protein EMIT040CA3_10145 [Bacillus pseudomycoides]